MKGEYKNILLEIFDVLGFSSSEKESALETFKKKLSFELLKSVQSELSQEQQEWLSQAAPDMNDPMLAEIRKTIQEKYSQEVLYEKSKPFFRALVLDYIQFMSDGLDEGSAAKLQEISSQI